MSGPALATLLASIESYLRRYVVLDRDQLATEALWVAHTHALEAAATTPYLAITSAEKRSGKTRNLELLERIVARPWFTGRTSAAALVRKTHKLTPTLLLDESDAAFASSDEYTSALRGVLNSGYKRGGKTTICVGQNNDFQDFNVFGPKAIAGIGRLPDTVEDRAIRIRLKRRAGSEEIRRYRRRAVSDHAAGILGGLEFWVSHPPLIEELREAEPELPEAINDRAAECWEPLFAIADKAGEEWAERARAVAVRLSGEGEPEDDSLGIRLLADCRRVIGDAAQVQSAALRNGLREIEDGPWDDFYGKPISLKRIGDLLHRYEISSTDIRFPEGVKKGYRRKDFEDSWRRYLPSKRNIRDNGSTKPETGPSQSATDAEMLRIENGHKPLEQANVALVADQDPEREPLTPLYDEEPLR